MAAIGARQPIDAFELALLLVRCNDWVTEVQSLALAAASKRVTVAYAEDWCLCLPLVARWELAERRKTDLADLAGRVETLLRTAAARPALLAGLHRGALATRRACLSITMALPPSDAIPMWRRAASDSDPWIEERAATAILSSAPLLEGPVSALARAHELSKHRLPRVRMAAIRRASTLDPDGARAAWRGALLDGTRGVRELARYELAKLDAEIDFATLYRHECERVGLGPSARSVAFEAYAEVARDADLPFLLPVLEDWAPRVRAAAITALGRVDATRSIALLEHALRKPSALVRRAAVPHARRVIGRRAFDAAALRTPR